jgi:hypothetical protein
LPGREREEQARKPPDQVWSIGEVIALLGQ